MTILCIFIQTVFREDIRRYYDIILYFYSGSIQRGFRHQDAHTKVLLHVEDAFGASFTQTHAVPGFLVLYHWKVALNCGCAGEDGCQTADEPLQQQVRVVQSVPSILVRGALVKAVNGSLHIRLAAVQVTQGLVLAPNIINLLNAEGVVKRLPLALQIDGEVAGRNTDKLME